MYKRLQATDIDVVDTLFPVYQVPREGSAQGSDGACVSKIWICNRNKTGASIHIGLVDSWGESLEDEEYLVYDELLPGRSYLVLEYNIPMESANTLVVQSNLAGLSVQVFGEGFS